MYASVFQRLLHIQRQHSSGPDLRPDVHIHWPSGRDKNRGGSLCEHVQGQRPKGCGARGHARSWRDAAGKADLRPNRTQRADRQVAAAPGHHRQTEQVRAAHERQECLQWPCGVRPGPDAQA